MSGNNVLLNESLLRVYILYFLFSATPTSVTLPCSHAGMGKCLPLRERTLKFGSKLGDTLSSREQPGMFR